MSNPRFFSIEGNIGSGKTTLLNDLHKALPEAQILPEPIDLWQNISGSNLLSNFYKDPKRWAFTFELQSMLTKARNIKKCLDQNTNLILMERSIFSDQVFQNISFNYGNISSLEYHILNDITNDIYSTYPKLNGVIYLNINVGTCLKRIKIRGRQEEQKISEKYLTDLEENFLSINYGCPILLIEETSIDKSKDNIIKKILNFINNYV